MLHLRNPLYMHIASEIIVVTGLVVWMSGYRKRTTSQIEKLLLRIEEQDEKIQKLEQQFAQFQQQQRLASTLAAAAAAAPIQPQPKPRPPIPSKPIIPVQPVQPVQPARLSTEEVDEDLDALIQAELAELVAAASTPALVQEEISTGLVVPSDDGALAEIEEISTDDLKKKEP